MIRKEHNGMLGIGEEDLSGRYLLEWMPLHKARRQPMLEEGQRLCMWSSVSFCG